MIHSVLFIDDDATGREVAAHNLRLAGFEPDLAEDGEQGLARFDPARHSVVITDLKMPRVDGLEVLRRIHDRSPDTPVLVITAYGSMEVGVEAMRAGAYDVVAKPFHREQLELTVRRAAEKATLSAEKRRLERLLAGVERPIVHRSRAMVSLLETLDRVAARDATVLICGESGTGKELLARRVHARSRRGDGPFVAVSCAALPRELLESELFGHERGAFTGATRARDGRFRRAAGGTIFLDEVGELPLALQGKLLRVLQERVVDVVGRDEPVAVDTRVVAATNQNLGEMVARGSFREDLYFRLAVVELRVPPLRERLEDLEPLVDHFVQQASLDRSPSIPRSVRQALRDRPWPGNVRELENACERLAILAPGHELRLEDLPPSPAATGSEADSDWLDHLPPGLSLVDLERQAISQALSRCAGNISAAARLLGVPRHILVYRIEKHGLRRG
jgi:DNA-binding NtrC family response regulator